MKKTLQALENRGIEAKGFTGRGELLDYLKGLAQDASHIAFGGSVTLQELGLYDLLQAMGKTVTWHWKVPPEARSQALEKAMQSDLYLCSANALTEDGRIINIDGTGNRVAATCFGHRHVVFVVGANKIVPDLDTGLARIKQEACPKNAARLGKNTPCKVTGRCHDCHSEDRMCNVVTIIEGRPGRRPMTVCLLAESMGY